MCVCTLLQWNTLNRSRGKIECATLGVGFQSLFLFIDETLKIKVTRSILCFKLSSKKTAHPEMSGAMGACSAFRNTEQG